MYWGQIYLGQATLPLHGWDEQIQEGNSALRRRATWIGSWWLKASGFLSNSHSVASSMMNIKLKVRLQWISAQLPRTNTQLLCVQLNLLSMEKAGGEKSHLSCYISSAITSLPVMLFVLCCRYLRKKRSSHDAWTTTAGSISASVSVHNTCTRACFRYLRILPLFYDYQSWLFS